MDESTLAKRVLQLEVALATLAADMRNHIMLCDARMRVLWKLAAVIGGVVAAIVSVGIALITRQ